MAENEVAVRLGMPNDFVPLFRTIGENRVQIRVKDWCPIGDEWTHKTICHSCMSAKLWQLVSPEFQRDPIFARIVRLHRAIRECIHTVLISKDAIPRSERNTILLRLSAHKRRLLGLNRREMKMQEIRTAFAIARSAHWRELTRGTKFTAQQFLSLRDGGAYGNFIAVPPDPIVAMGAIGIAFGLAQQPTILAGCPMCLQEIRAVTINIQFIEDVWLLLLPAELFADAVRRCNDPSALLELSD